MDVTPAKVWYDAHSLARELGDLVAFWKAGGFRLDVVMTSMGADPPHRGHIACLTESARLASISPLVVVANGDGFLTRKKGSVFLPLEDRVAILSAVRGVSHVLVWDDGTQYVDGAIRIIRPRYFTKGGDRTPSNFAEPERVACEEVNCEIVFGVGGGKIQSSSWLTQGSR
jgi:bifunctional ADP-heptose synthase (sugar kinase/adenylyltransferase)